MHTPAALSTVSPLRQPRPFLSAQWRKLLLINYAVDPSLLAPYLPFKTELDLWNGQCYVSLVGFLFTNVQLKGIAVPFHTTFEEVNLRFYVKYHTGSEWKRGVVFIKEIVPLPALTFVANTIYKEKYQTMPMRHSWNGTDQLEVSYDWYCNQHWNHIKVFAAPKAEEISPQSEEEFITEHYWGYTRINDRTTGEYEVQHPRWKTYDVQHHEICVDFKSTYGEAFDALQHLKIASVMLAEGSPIAVLGKKIIT